MKQPFNKNTNIIPEESIIPGDFSKRKFQIEPLKNLLFNDNLGVSNPTWRFKFSPYSSWTYCEPNCSTGEQALDFENAFDNAYADMFSAVSFIFLKNFRV